MLSDFNATCTALARTPAMQLEINSCSRVLGLENSPAANFIRDKGPTSPFFYTAAFRFAANRMSEPIDINGLERLADGIIIIDEIAEHDPHLLSRNQCLDLAMRHTGMADFPEKHPLVASELNTMYGNMGRENEYNVKWNRPLPTALPQVFNGHVRYQEYREAVDHSIGVKPFFALLAEQHQEAASFQFTDYQTAMDKLETATRILCDEITLGKDQKHPRALNLVTEYQTTHDCSLRVAQMVLSHEAHALISSGSEAISESSPVFMRFAKNFAQVMEEIALLPERSHKLSPWPQILGWTIANVVFPVQKEKPVELFTGQAG
jgi:hypothetical protein